MVGFPKAQANDTGLEALQRTFFVLVGSEQRVKMFPLECAVVVITSKVRNNHRLVFIPWRKSSLIPQQT